MKTGYLILSTCFILTINVSAQGTRAFKGRLISFSGDNSIVKRVPVRIVGVNSGMTTDDGTFTIAISDKLNELTVQLDSASKNTIVSPIGGKVNVPANQNAVTDFYIGEPPEAFLKKAIAKSSSDIKQSLEKLGIKQDGIDQTLNAFMAQIQEMTNIKISDLRDELEIENQRRAFYPGFSSMMMNYINEAKDIKDAFKFTANHAFEDPLALKVLNEAIANYNVAYEQLNNSRKNDEKTVMDLWQGSDKVSEVRELFNFALGVVHGENIYALNSKGNDINDYNRGEYHNLKKNAFKASVVREIDFLVFKLDKVLSDLDNRTQIVLSRLAN